MKEAETILHNQKDFLKYLKAKFVLIHMSNLFFRDLHYGVMAYLRDHGMRAGYTTADDIARKVAAGLEQSGVLKKIDHQSWLLLYPEFALPKVEKKPS
jgi:hypothetical protein